MGTRSQVLSAASDALLKDKGIRQRLQIMCDGRLTIEPDNGKGTVAMVTVPDSDGQ